MSSALLLLRASATRLRHAAASRVTLSSIYTSSCADVNIPNMNLLEFLNQDNQWADLGDKNAVICGVTGTSIKFGDLESKINAAADGLRNQGFSQGDVLSIHSANSPEWILGLLAAVKLGGIVSPSNPAYTSRELHHQLNDAAATHVLTAAGLADTVKEAAEGTAVKQVNIVGDSSCFLETGSADASIPASPAGAQDLAVLPYSSGTTGLPKGVMLSHGNLVANLCQINDSPSNNLGLTPTDTILGLLPYFHIYGMVVIMASALKQGATQVTLPAFEPQQFLQAMQDNKVTFAPLVPPLVLFTAKHPLVQQFDLSAVHTVFCGAAPLDAALSREFAAATGISVRQGYGMTELSPVSHMNPASHIVHGSVGRLVANMEARVVDGATGQDASEGELWVRGPNVMQGYLNRPDATAEIMMGDGFLNTGDLVVVSEDEHGIASFVAVDRTKDLIKVKGFQVAPAELEGLLLTHPAVADSAVIGIDVTDKHGLPAEAPKGFVVLKPGQCDGGSEEEKEELRQQIMAHVASTVADFKQLHTLEFIDAIPKSASGKILRRTLQ